MNVTACDASPQHSQPLFAKPIEKRRAKSENPAAAGFLDKSATSARRPSDHRLRQLALRIALRDLRQRLGLDLRGLAFAAELDVALAADLLGRFARRLQVVARVELLG